MDFIKSRSSEIVLLVMLIVLFGCVRIYYGGEQAFMIVWKGELNYSDTIVSLDQVLEMDRKDLLARHRAIFLQLEDMGLLQDQPPNADHLRWKRKQQQRSLSGTVMPEGKAEQTPGAQ